MEFVLVIYIMCLSLIRFALKLLMFSIVLLLCSKPMDEDTPVRLQPCLSNFVPATALSNFFSYITCHDLCFHFPFLCYNLAWTMSSWKHLYCNDNNWMHEFLLRPLSILCFCGIDYRESKLLSIQDSPGIIFLQVKNEEEEFNTGPLSVLMLSVKNNTQVYHICK